MPRMQPVPLDSVNGLSQAEFVTLLAEVFERAAWVAEAVAPLRPFATVTALHDAMLAAVAAAPDKAVTEFLNRHPDLAGPSARKDPLTAHSAREQAGAGLDRLTAEETARLAAYNARYRANFGFPFIICARRHTKDAIFAEFEERIRGEQQSLLAARLLVRRREPDPEQADEHRARLHQPLHLARQIDADGNIFATAPQPRPLGTPCSCATTPSSCVR